MIEPETDGGEALLQRGVGETGTGLEVHDGAAPRARSRTTSRSPNTPSD